MVLFKTGFFREGARGGSEEDGREGHEDCIVDEDQGRPVGARSKPQMAFRDDGGIVL